MSPYLSKNYRYPRKSRLQSLREAGKFLGLSILSIILVLFILGWVAYAFQASAAVIPSRPLNQPISLNNNGSLPK